MAGGFPYILTESKQILWFFIFALLFSFFSLILNFDIIRLDPFKCGLKVDPDRTIFEIVDMKLYMNSLSFTFFIFIHTLIIK